MKTGLVGAAAAWGGGDALGALLAGESLSMPQRVLGRTGVRVGVVGIGAMECSDPEVIREALDRGVNYVDTADCYMGGQNEKIVGQALSGVRDRVFVATKVHVADEGSMVASIERSLQSLRTDRVDLIQLHGISSRGEVANGVAKEVLGKMREKGRIRFAGVTTHSNQEEVVRAVVADGFYDAVLVAFNFRSPESLAGAIAEAGARGVAVIAMKTQNGGFSGSPYAGITPHQAALRHVLERPGIACAVPGMYSFRMLDENLGVLATPPGPKTGRVLERYRRELAGKACAFCSQCLGQCRSGGGGMDAARVALYLDGYRDRRLAAERAAWAREGIGRCALCPECTVRCPQGIDIRGAAQRAAALLS